MELFIVIAIFIILIVVFTGGRKKNIQPPAPDSQPETKKENYTMAREKAKEMTQNLLTVLKNQTSVDESIIDVSGQDIIIPQQEELVPETVPYWPHFYVYSFDAINRANAEQKKFYENFRTAFLNGIYLDLQGNTNYAFVLLFDLLQYYETHRSLDQLENHLKVLADHYARTRTYCKSFLVQKLRENSDYKGIIRIDADPVFQYQYHPSEYENQYERLGDKYKTKLSLTKEQEELVNKLWNPGNNFCSVEFCLCQTIKLFLAVVDEFNQKFAASGSNLNKELELIAAVVAEKHYKYKPDSYNFKYAVQSTVDEFYRLLFKYSENALREFYGHKRKINTDFNYAGEPKELLESRIINHLPVIFKEALVKIDPPDEATEIALNEQNTGRWKIAFEYIKKNYIHNSAVFYESVVKLGILNKNNLSVENLFFEASKCVAKMDREVALKCYVHYLYHDLQSVNIDKKQLTKTIQKSIFKSNEELHAFEGVISDLIKDRNLHKALTAIPEVFKPKRKRIKLDASAITEVRQKHSATVEILDELLADEYEDETTSIKAVQSSDTEVELAIASKTESIVETKLANLHGLNHTQLELLEVFAKNNFLVPAEDVESFARSQGLFKNTLIDSINETVYEHLDDLLIEEEDDSYIIQQSYYQKIVA